MAPALERGYLILGSDTAQVALLRSRLIEPVTGEGGHVEALDAAKATVKQVLMTLAQPPLSGGTLLVVVDNAHAWKAKEAAPLAAWLADPLPDTVLCLVCAKDPAKEILGAARPGGGCSPCCAATCLRRPSAGPRCARRPSGPG